MNARGHKLADDVSAAFTRACQEQDFAVAEHLLRALEVIASRDNEPRRLDQAYLEVAESTWPHKEPQS